MGGATHADGRGERLWEWRGSEAAPPVWGRAAARALGARVGAAPPLPPHARRPQRAAAARAVLPPSLPHRQVTATNVDIARVAPKWHLYTPEEVEEVIARL